jgi:hypothetical protein
MLRAIKYFPPIGVVCLGLAIGSFGVGANAQAPRSMNVRNATAKVAAQPAVPAATNNCKDLVNNDTPNFGTVIVGQAHLWCSKISIPVGAILNESGIQIQVASKGDDSSKVFKYLLTGTCDNSKGTAAANCYLSIGFGPLTAVETTALMVVTVAGPGGSVFNDTLDGIGTQPSPTAKCQPPNAYWFPASHGYSSPNDFAGVPDRGTGEKLYRLLGVGQKIRSAEINCYYATNDTVSFFNQIQSVYNGASTSASVSADLASLNFLDGMQMTLGTNIQAGPGAAPTAVAKGTTPTLSATSAAQAAQNMLYGGTIFASGMLPVYAYSDASPGGTTLMVDFAAKEGVDIQNFTSGTSTSLTSPPSHFTFKVEGYLEYNSTNLNAATNGIAGSVFVAGSYGYSYTSHGYARDYGIATGVNNGIGQVSAGVNASGVAKIAISRGFGPNQTYFDSATSGQTPAPPPVTVNNFKTWSFGITYQPKSSSN